MKNAKILTYSFASIALLSLFLNSDIYSMNSSDEENFIEEYGFDDSKVKYGPRKRPEKIDINFKKGNKKYTYSLTSAEVNKAIKTAGKIRKKKEKKAQNESPLVPTDTIPFTSNVGGKKKIVDAELYQINNKEDKRRFRNVAQDFYDKSIESREKGTPRPDPIFVQRGTDQTTDLSILRSGLDVGLSPLEVREGQEGYVALKPPPYGDEVDETSQAFQNTLKIIEGTRSNTASVLRHIAEEDEDFLGKSKGGAKKLRNFDKGSVAKKDQENTMNLFASVFAKKVDAKKIQKKKDFPSKDVILEEVITELGTETDSPSFYSVEEDDRNEQEKLEDGEKD